jgi:hypothetical protein
MRQGEMKYEMKQHIKKGKKRLSEKDTINREREREIKRG